MRRLEHGMAVADIGRRREAHASDETGGKVGEDVAEHGLGRQHVEVPAAPDEVERHRIDVVGRVCAVRVRARLLVEHSSHEGEGAEHVRLVNEPDLAASAAHPRAVLGEPEGEACQTLGARAGDPQRLFGHVGDPAAAARMEQPSVLSRTITRSIPRARGAASATGTPGIARTGRTPA
jgi:hypothetical protein